jgi:hypothetical protein
MRDLTDVAMMATDVACLRPVFVELVTIVTTLVLIKYDDCELNIKASIIVKHDLIKLWELQTMLLLFCSLPGATCVVECHWFLVMCR